MHIGLVYQNLPASDCSIAQLLGFVQGAGNRVKWRQMLTGAIFWRKMGKLYVVSDM